MYKIMLADDEGIVIDSLKFIIEKEFISFDMYLAHTGIRIDMINHFSFGIQYFQFDVV